MSLAGPQSVAGNDIVSVLIKSRSDLKSVGSAQLKVTFFAKAARIYRAIKAGLICWLIGVFCILVPILHFVLVPAFFFLGLFMLMQQWSLRLYLEDGQTIHCPSCKGELLLKCGAFDWPKREICSHCRADLQLDEVSDRS
jgi:hypothetical protein